MGLAYAYTVQAPQSQTTCNCDTLRGVQVSERVDVVCKVVWHQQARSKKQEARSKKQEADLGSQVCTCILVIDDVCTAAVKLQGWHVVQLLM